MMPVPDHGVLRGKALEGKLAGGGGKKPHYQGGPRGGQARPALLDARPEEVSGTIALRRLRVAILACGFDLMYGPRLREQQRRRLDVNRPDTTS